MTAYRQGAAGLGAALVLASWTGETLAARPVIAVAAVKGPKKADPLRFETAMTKAFASQNADFIGPKALKKRAKKDRDDPRSQRVADAAGADFLVRTRIKKMRRGFRLTAKLINLSGETTIETAKWNFKPSRKDRQESIQDNATKAAAAISAKFMRKINKIFPKMVGDLPGNVGALP